MILNNQLRKVTDRSVDFKAKASPISLQLLLFAMQTELQHFAFQVWLLHTLRAVLLTIVSKVTAESWKMLGWFFQCFSNFKQVLII